MLREQHWNDVYETKQSTAVSWFQATPTASLKMLDAAGLTPESRVIDVGGGDGRLVDSLLDRGVRHVTVLDISGAALARAAERLGERAAAVTWIEADVTGDWEVEPLDIWHDRAVFHFLIDAIDRAHYGSKLRMSLKPGGFAVIATFAPDGPSQCSGLPVMRYSAESLQMELGNDFELLESFAEPHQTPTGKTQAFLYTVFRLKT